MLCPYCFTKVVQRPDGTCPACSQDMNNVSPEALNRELLQIRVGDPVPDVCCRCGEYSTRKVSVSIYPDGTSEVNATRKYFGRLFHEFLTYASSRQSLLRTMMTGDDSVTVGQVGANVMMTQCRRCARVVEIEAHTVDYFGGQFHFVVHREYAREFRACQLIQVQRD